jgi:hypothetical protein
MRVKETRLLAVEQLFDRRGLRISSAGSRHGAELSLARFLRRFPFPSRFII